MRLGEGSTAGPISAGRSPSSRAVGGKRTVARTTRPGATPMIFSDSELRNALGKPTTIRYASWHPTELRLHRPGIDYRPLGRTRPSVNVGEGRRGRRGGSRRCLSCEASPGPRSTSSSRASARGERVVGARASIVSAHTTDVVPDLINGAQTDLFCENLRRYLAGEELLNVLDKRLLY